MNNMPSLWSILPDELNKLKQAHQTYLASNKSNSLDNREAQIAKIPQTFFMDGDIGVMQIEGVIMPKANLFSLIFGGATLDVMTRDFNALVADDNIKAIILEIDSPGGVVFGIQEFANMVFEARERKPVFAISSAMMSSAACWIGTAANEVYITDEAVVTGSIGVVIEHIDISELERKIGIKTTEVTSGKYKRIASSVRPLSDEGREELQSWVDHVYTAFTSDIAKFRGVSTDTVLTNMADGKTFIGSQAIDAGLVDGLKNQEQLFDSINEAARIKDVEAQSLPGHEALIRSFKLDGHTTGQEAAIAVLRAEKMKTVETGNFKNNFDGGKKMIMAQGKDFKTLMNEYQAEHKCTKLEALKACGKLYPDEFKAGKEGMKAIERSHPEARTENKTAFETLVAEYMKEHKCGKGRAIMFVANSHPDAHKEYVAALRKR